MAAVRPLATMAGRLYAGVRTTPRTASVAISLMAVGALLSVARPPDHARPTVSDARPPVVVPHVVVPHNDLMIADAVPAPRVSPAEDILSVIPVWLDPADAWLAAAAKHDSAENRLQTVTVQPGETLGTIFQRLGLGNGLVNQIVALNEDTRGLTRIRPGDTFIFDISPQQGFKAMRAARDDENWLWVESSENGLSSRLEGRDLERRPVEAVATITSSLYSAGKQAGLKDRTVLELARIFGWDIDFALDIRSGDQFTLVYEQVYRDGKYLRDGEIIAARFVNQGSVFEAVRFENGDGADYYGADGRSMRQAFLRAPVDFTRVSSDFNPRRLHPVTRRVRPHNGTDYAAPTGTPVWAAGEGRVIEAAYNRANGNYVFIQHGDNVVTRYLHLSKRHVNRGDRVRQGEVIGLVGATGLANGPHLHYEFLVAGNHRNPRTVELPNGVPLEERALADFQRRAEPLLAQLETLAEDEQVMVAQRSEPKSPRDSED